MFTLASRTLLVAAVALASLASSPARGDLPVHIHLQELTLLPEEAFWPDGLPRDNEFGTNAVIRNGLAFIGMPKTMTTGQVAVFTQGTSGWARTGTIVASDRTTGDRFGQSISFRDGLLVVGSARAIYVYKRVNGAWREQQKIVPPAADELNVVGDLQHEAGVLAFVAFSSSDFRHAFYVFEQDANGRFVRRARFLTSAAEGFPFAIDMTKRMIVVGTTSNSAYLFGRNKSGQWVKRQQLIASSRTQPNDGFGLAVAIDNDMILVATPDSAWNDTDLIGEVYVFLPGATKYVEAFRLQPPLDDRLAGGWRFGSVLAITDKYIAVGAVDVPFLEDIPPGRVTTYSREGFTVRLLGTIDIKDTAPTVARGPSILDIANDLLLVGSRLDKSCGAFNDLCEPTGINIGEVHVFRLNRFKP